MIFVARACNDNVVHADREDDWLDSWVLGGLVVRGRVALTFGVQRGVLAGLSVVTQTVMSRFWDEKVDWNRPRKKS